MKRQIEAYLINSSGKLHQLFDNLDADKKIVMILIIENVKLDTHATFFSIQTKIFRMLYSIWLHYIYHKSLCASYIDECLQSYGLKIDLILHHMYHKMIPTNIIIQDIDIY